MECVTTSQSVKADVILHVSRVSSCPCVYRDLREFPSKWAHSESSQINKHRKNIDKGKLGGFWLLQGGAHAPSHSATARQVLP